MKRLLFVDHSFHKKTSSSSFFIDILKKNYEITYAVDDSWSTRYNEIGQCASNKIYDVVIFWQLINKNILKSIECRNIVFVPMYDGCGDKGLDFWYPYRDIKIVNFSRSLESFLSKAEFRTLPVKYYPELAKTCVPEGKSCFFWQRINEIGWPLVKTLLKETEIRSIHMHRAVDPGHVFYQPSIEDIDKYKITFSDWFSDKNKYKEIMYSKQIYIAPRIKEGIGLSFLEAMAAGLVVVAPNLPTMSEYIVNAENGYLYDPYHPVPIRFGNLARVAQNAKDTMLCGQKAWAIDKGKIIDFIESPMRRNFYFRSHPFEKYSKKSIAECIKRLIKYILPYGLIKLHEKKALRPLEGKDT